VCQEVRVQSVQSDVELNQGIALSEEFSVSFAMPEFVSLATAF
jgi:hypothetical protein